MTLSAEAVQVVRDLNPWWDEPGVVRPAPPAYRRPIVRQLLQRLCRPRGIIEVVRGPRQVGKTTGVYQIVQDLLEVGTDPRDILLVRFDLTLLREERAALRSILHWYVAHVRRRPLDRGAPTFVFLDEVHKLPRWHEEVKHLGDSHPVRLLLTGSSSLLAARGGRESLTGRIFSTELPTFSFREVLECWHPEIAAALPAAIGITDAFEDGLIESSAALQKLRPQQRSGLRRVLARYYARGGYPRLHSGEVDEDRWADYLVQTVFENVLGADIPDLFPVSSPGLLRHLYLTVARLTAQEIPQNQLAQTATAAGFATNQPTVGKYLRYLADALLIREFRRYPLAKKSSARVPSKITLTDLGVRNAIFRGAPSLWESDPALLGPLVETMAQGSIRGPNLQTHFFREYEHPSNRRSAVREVDFVAERIDGRVLPIEVKFRRKIDPADTAGVLFFMSKFRAHRGVLITREASRWDGEKGLLYLPLEDFLAAF